MNSSSSEQTAISIGPRNRLGLLLIALVFALLLLLVSALWESREDVKIARDTNRCGSLRSKCLLIYNATSLPGNSGRSALRTGIPDWRGTLLEMERIRSDLRRRYPEDVIRSDRHWVAFQAELRRNGRVEWKTTSALFGAVDDLTGKIERLVEERMQRMTLIYAFGIAGIAFALPWGVVLFSELKEAQRRLAEENAEREQAARRYSSLFADLPVACFTFDTDGQLRIWNQEAEAVFSKPASTVLGRPLSGVFAKFDPFNTTEIVSTVLAGEPRNGLEWKYALPRAKAKRLLSNVFPIHDSEKGITGGVMATVDITALKEAEERLHSVLVGVRCIVWDAIVEEIAVPPFYHWTLQLWNEEAAQQIVPLDVSEVDYVRAWIQSRDGDQDQMDATSSAALRHGLPGYTQEFRCRDRYGALHWLREDVHIRMLEPGRWRTIGVCTDITGRKEAEERLREMTMELERSNAALQDFASIASHDLKEPLRKIQTFGSMLSKKVENLSPEAQSYLDRMQAAAVRMQALIDGLLSYSRITAKGNEFASTDLNEVVKGVLNDLEVRIQEVGAAIKTDPLPTVYADTVQMRQLFQNLIGNALKFHREDEPACIRIEYARRDGRHVISVIDNGIGFSTKDAERIFEVFERLEGSGREGTGIGLAICRKIAERHGGMLTATGTPGVGATFVLTL
ncbi:MAG: ATP-binding protein [Capsulimonadales bacterium]|nr:ATP-binding protein [Capsulimonadales bacterium]